MTVMQKINNDIFIHSLLAKNISYSKPLSTFVFRFGQEALEVKSLLVTQSIAGDFLSIFSGYHAHMIAIKELWLSDSLGEAYRLTYQDMKKEDRSILYFAKHDGKETITLLINRIWNENISLSRISL